MDDLLASRALGRLRALLGRAGLHAGARGIGERVVDRLTRPLRVTVVGSGTAFQRAIVDGFLGASVLPAGHDLPPIRVGFGARHRIVGTFATGESRPLDEGEIAGIDPFDLAMLDIAAPLPILETLTLLYVALEGDAGERRRATLWAAEQADVVIWAFDATDAADVNAPVLWAALPEAIRDHAFLAVPERAGALPQDSETMFYRVCRVAADGAAMLRQAVLDHVSAARREDIERALMLLEGQAGPGDLSLLPPDPTPAEGPDPAPLPPTPTPTPTERVADQAAPYPGDEDDRTIAFDVVRLLAHRAGTLDGGPDPDAAALLSVCSDALEDCAALAHDAGPVAEILDEALELMLLLGLEGTPTALTDGLALMVQVRRECAALAA